jgi:microcystin-dependent protein
MGTPYLGEVKMVAFNFPPKGWAFCNGQLLSIAQNAALFSILGTTYGGDGRVNFGLPNLQQRVPLHMGNGFVEGQVGGSASVTLNVDQIGHSHPVNATATPTTNTATGGFPATASDGIYGSSVDTTMNPAIVSPTGGSQAHNNLQPYLVINYVIALVGIFPSRN